MILQCVNIKKSFGDKDILKDCSFIIEENEKVALTGKNGAGKTTLLKIIAGEMLKDGGNLIFSSGLTKGYLSQYQEFKEKTTIYEEVLKAKEKVIQLEENIRILEMNMKHSVDEELSKVMKEYERITHEYEKENGFSYQSEIKGVLQGLGFSSDEFEKKVQNLSGGEKTRVALAKLLLIKPRLLLLDEPTNHLDMNAIQWLENYLLNYKGSVLIVTHDRYFLDKVVSKVVDVYQGKSLVYSGNYTDFAKKKEQYLENEIRKYENQQKEIRRQEEIIVKLRSFNREKSIKRAESREKLLEKIDINEKPIFEESKMKFQIIPDVMSGKDVLKVSNLKKSFQEKNLFSDISFQIYRGEKVAIIGDNGTGKTTLIKIINEIIPPDGGEVKRGTNVNIGYYDQEHNLLSEDNTILEEVEMSAPEVSTSKIRSILATFMFYGDDVFKKIKDLSGGEKGRISLAKLMLSKANFLVMDEPTNHLDNESREVLEKVLLSYEGTVLYVSHDRYFINQTATKIIQLFNQSIVEYQGNYDYFLDKKEVELNQNIEKYEETEGKADWRRKKEEQAKERKVANDIKKTEKEIILLEEKAGELEKQMGQEEIACDLERLLKITKERDEIARKIESLYEIWENLAK